MQTYKKLLLAAAATLAITGNAFAETLKFGIEAAYPPFNNKDASGQVVGFDYEIAQALCAKMKVECQPVTSDWDGIIPALNAKKFDFLISSLSITDERKQAVDFTDPYYSNKLQFIAPKTTEVKGESAAELKESLKGKTIGAQRATLASTWLEDNMGSDANVSLYDTQENAYLDLSAGRTDALLADKYVSYEWLKSDAGKNFEFKGKPVEENDKVGIAVRKGDDPLREKLNAALKEIIADGTYKKINDKYFPFSIL
ncbi:ABC transporter substrate-binding protein [Pseudomonas sp. DTU_2021_1001937_2_SI_NGA_ILE_001]|uniref:ABC transporter substrate-binding protein n=1 Tax=Pseudomonas sp. DTU_2021_1001937_2_SI_NGA_ILE_001 TaxID=3077589 RepID=UPI0028FC1D02|nr:ABC transporter substrate-binding protein [Pseudomonas sp. DTU_2021_1001937_2_SI_NGA_ILE_001]WNW12401.1 ABC transporter substrate-binding protein [Pseudomonas sp. DTU_2021_1001937_2_SI_NGA_ILE_001]